MNLSEIFIRRPIATSLLMAAIALFGIVAYRTLPVSDLPSVDFPTINVNANLPGADPNTMASSVATVLERQFTTIAGVNEMTSQSSTGSTQITLQFDLDRDIDSATVDVQTAIAAVTPLLPQGMPTPPSFKKNNPNDQPILQLMLTSNIIPMNQLDEFAETMMAQRISMTPGVAQVNVQGSQKFAVRVQLDPDRLVGKRIGLNEVSTALQNWNVNLPTGTLFGADKVYNIQANGQLMNAAAFKPMVVAYRNGGPVRLEEIANVVDSVENDKNVATRYSPDGNERGIQLQVMKQPGSNSVEVADRVNSLMPQFVSKFPPSVHLQVRSDRSKNIRESIRDIQATMLVTLLLVVLVIFAFLLNGSATVIPSLALPFSLLGTFAVMAMLHYSLDTISMMALILAITFVVDDAIVMLENIVRHVEQGASPYQAALDGSKEIGFTIISMTVSLSAVFIPVLFMGGILGRLFREFAVTITTAILVSGLVSITLTPMLCSRFLRVRAHGAKGWFTRAMEWPFDQMAKIYAWTLRGVLRARPLMAILFVGVLVATWYLFGMVKKGFIPDSDTDFLQLNMIAPQGTSYYQIVKYQETVANLVRKDPNVVSFMSNPGGGNRSFMGIQLKPRRERKQGAQEVIQNLRPKLTNFPGFQVTLSMPQSLKVGGRNTSSSYQLEVRGPDTAQLYEQAQILERAVARIPEVLEVNSDLEVKSPRVDVMIDRERSAVYGLTANDIEQALYNAYGPSIASTIYGPANQYHVMLEVQPKYQAFTDYLSKVYFKAPAGQLVPLDSLASIKQDVGPQSINHSGQLPSVTISFNVKPGVSLGEAVDKVEVVAKDTLPANMVAHFAGNAQAFQDSLKNLTLLLTVAVLVTYIVLGILYESYIQPLTILSGLPSAMMGGLLTLYLFKAELNIFSFVGLIVLIGIVKKNAIMQVDFALSAERTGLSPTEAIYQGCLIRFRPIMMTTAAAFLGAIPTALGYGSGGEARAPLGLAVAGGLFFSQLMTLYLTPVVYTYMSAMLAWRRNRAAAGTVTPAPGFGD
ncbi:MAG TPA: efflux RND transporter permease subunit [Bryobacteraceae bacterium]|nr:efflux RND transporter permease subunit [Bryobacteraceae bacterium]